MRAEATSSLRGVAGVSVYAPLLRLGWDENAFTLTAKAVRGAARNPARVVFASTSAPFIERRHARLPIDALALSLGTRGRDVAGSRRGAVSARLDAPLASGSALAAADERRIARPGPAPHLTQGDGGAADCVADDAATRVNPGERILLAGFGCGCDALVLEMTRPTPSRGRVEAALRQGMILDDYVRLLNLDGALDIDWGVRSGFEPGLTRNPGGAPSYSVAAVSISGRLN